MEWHLDICNNFISFHFARVHCVCARQFRRWVYIFSRLHFYRQANTFNYCITTFSVNFPSPCQRTTDKETTRYARLPEHKIKTALSFLYITPQTNQSTNQKWATQLQWQSKSNASMYMVRLNKIGDEIFCYKYGHSDTVKCLIVKLKACKNAFDRV